jgi:Ca-activated chloride channel family protein
MQVKPERDRRPLLIAAVFALLFASGLGAWPSVQAQVCPSILVASSNEKYPLMDSLAKEFSSSYPASWSGCGPSVKVAKVASGDAERLLSDGWTGAGRPDVWSPAAYTWVLLLKHHLKMRHQFDLVPDTQYPSIATSPLVVAMPREMATAIGWPKVKPSWKDLFLFAQDARGWGQFGKPTWGAFRLGKTDPGKSTSGIHSMIATYYAATGKLMDLTLDDLENQATHDFAVGVEKSVSHYAPTVGSFLDYLAIADDPNGYISALAVEEQEVFHYNRGGHSGTGQLPRVSLEAISPSDGTLAADHPFVILHWPWVGPAKQKLATAFLAWLLMEDQQKKFFDEGFRDRLGNAHKTLANEVGISAKRPTILDPPDQAVVAAVQKKWLEIRKSARILILLALADASQRDYVRDGVKALSGKDAVAVWALRGKTLSTLPPTSLDEPGRAQVLRAIGSAPTARAAVPLYATIREGYRFLKGQFDPARINAIVVIAANSDDGSGPSVIELQREVRTEPTGSPIRIYTVALKGSSRSQLETIERASGGVAFSSDDPGDAIRTALANF